MQQTFDAKGRLASIAAGSTTYVNNFSYTVAGQVSAFSYGNGVAASFGFNAARLQLESLSYANGSTTLLSLAYGYTQNGGNNGQITGITDTTGTQEGGRSVSYTYDALHRLKTAETTGTTGYPKWGLEWSYDRYGNRLSQSISDGCVSPMTCPTNSVSVDSATNRLTGSPYVYDENGNMLHDGLNTLMYDAESRVVRVNSSNPMYVYDGAGLRVKKCDPHCTSPTTTTVYVFSGTQVIAEYVNGAAVNSPTREYVYSGSQLIATHEGTSPKFHHQDHLSRRITSDGTSGSQTYGEKIADSGHFPYGESWYESGGTVKLKFTSYERDGESGNDFAIFRYYSNRNGRFCSADPLAGSTSDPQSLNRFAYVVNDPINHVDPLGLSCRQVCTNITGQEPHCTLECDSDPEEDSSGSDSGSATFVNGCADMFLDGMYIGNTCTGFYGDLYILTPPDEGSLTEELNEDLADALRNLSKRCRGILPFDKLKALVGNIAFYDGRTPTGDGALKASAIVSGGVDKTLNQLIRTGDAALVLRNGSGQVTKNVVIGRVWNILDPSGRGATLVHEAWHIATGRDDRALWNLAKSNGAVPAKDRGPSANLTDWINAGCPDQRRK